MSDQSTLKIYFDPGMTVEDMTLRFSTQLSDEVRETLASEGVDYSEIIELSNPVEVLDALAPYLTGGGFLLLRSVIVQVLRRNQGKKFKLKVYDHEIEVEGYSEKEVQRFLDVVERKAVENAEGWKNLNEGRDAGE